MAQLSLYQMMLAAFPSPGSGSLELGPLSLHAYGFCIALGVVAAVWLGARRWRAHGGSPEDVTTIAVWSVPAGVIGARIYHVLTDFELYRDDPLQALEIWDGGLGIWGGIAVGVTTGLLLARRKGIDPVAMLDAATPGIVLAQAIGRWGNYFNQELYGKPSDLPWALNIDVENRPAESLTQATYHPTFLYESLWNLALCAALLYLSRRVSLRPGSLFAAYVAGYTFARFFIEQLRVDFANTILDVRINVWVSAVVFVIAASWLYLRENGRERRRRHKNQTADQGLHESSGNS